MIKKINDSISIFFTEEGFSKSNAVLIDDDTRIIIDSGVGKLIEHARPENVDILINSHCHLDHVWDNDLFVNARILTHPLERENFKDHQKIASLDNWEKYMREQPAQHFDLKESFFEEWRVDGTIDEGDVIDAGRTKIHVLHMPGHTSGHLTFFFPDEGLLFSADICLTKVGPWYGDGSTPLDSFISSINRIIDMKPDKVVSGHNKEILKSSHVREAFEEYRERIYRREKDILAALIQKPRTIDELAEKMLIYPAHPTIFVLYWEKAMLAKHLDRLIKSGKAAVDDEGKYYAI
ncbi:MAG TPA: MBL fold metallo-hydrolase [Deltaproteobacteria bacterium]|nr:MBL fold metallo-hydrolase [Deltaproteobacteria bacterium]